jgi:hypothetical protein
MSLLYSHLYNHKYGYKVVLRSVYVTNIILWLAMNTKIECILHFFQSMNSQHHVIYLFLMQSQFPSLSSRNNQARKLNLVETTS